MMFEIINPNILQHTEDRIIELFSLFDFEEKVTVSLLQTFGSIPLSRDHLVVIIKLGLC